jgi:hypothetical protein
MSENPILAQLANLTGAFVAANNPSTEELQLFQNNIATALLQQQPADQMQQSFQFEKMENFSTQLLSESDLLDLNKVLQNAESDLQNNSNIRAFRREVPFVSSQVKGSMPDWARGAKITNTIGPLIDLQGRRFWWDFYNIVPGVQLFLQGAATPSMILSVEVSWFQSLFHNNKNYVIPQCSVWINAHLLSSSAPDTQYCGLTVKSGTLHFTQDVTISNKQMIVSPATTVTVTLELLQQTDTSVSPDNTGIDAKNASIQLPPTFSLSFSESGSHVVASGNASWTLYGQPDSFVFDTSQPVFYLKQFNRICIPYQSEQVQFDVINCNSTVCNISGTASIAKSAWSLNCAVLDINNPLVANGIGGMMIHTDKGLLASWVGLQDINLQNREWIDLRMPWILVEPGRISITDLNAGNSIAKQEYKLWKGVKGRWNTIDLQYTDSFLLFYNCLQSGNETVMAMADCTGTIDKPVNVAGVPFKLKSKQTLFMLTWLPTVQLVYLYDDNLLSDNNDSDPASIITFKSQAIALNNALLTVSPITGFLLAGELKNKQEFSKTFLLYSFGLLGYLPTLPDPYAADLDIFKGVYRIYEGYNKEGGIPINVIKQLLIAMMTWDNDTSPSVKFLWGNMAAASSSANNTQLSQGQNYQQAVPLDIVTDKSIAFQHSQQVASRQSAILSQQYRDAGNTYNSPAEAVTMLNNESATRGGIQNLSLFSLLDVSTNADLLGVNFGFVNDQYIFGETFKITPVDTTQNPLAIYGMDVVATSRFARIFTVPQISWEPVLNITPAFNAVKDPPFGVLKYDTDGIPALIGNTGLNAVVLAPIPLTNEVVTNYTNDVNFKAWSLFTLPNGMVSIGRYNQSNHYYEPPLNTNGAKIELIKASFKGGVEAGLQIVTKAGANPTENNKVFEGSTQQFFNVKSLFNPGNWSILGETVTKIFNDEFAGNVKARGVPVERYDFTGYGAQVFSHWLNNNADITQVSQSIFDIWKGRVAKEIIQVRSIIYPWAIRVVRTITMYRSSTGFEYRVDSGWRADSDGIYNFKTKVEPGIDFIFHAGVIRGVYKVRNIVENYLAPYNNTWFKTYGVYVDPNDGTTQPVGSGINLDVQLVPVYFDADVYIHDVDGTALDPHGVPVGQYVPSKKMLGYLQVAPKGVIISQQDFAAVIDLQNGLGGPVDSLLNINGSGQKMRVSRVEVNHSLDETNKIVFVSAAMGMPVLPKDGSWSLVIHNKTSKEVHPITDTVVSLIRNGALGSYTPPHAKEITATSELFKVPTDRLTQFGFLQNTDTQKVLYRNPFFNAGENLLHSTMPDLGDAYRLLNSKGIFPNLDNLQSINLDGNGCATKIIEEGYQMVDKLTTNTLKSLAQDFDKNATFTFIDKPGILKVYVDYAKTDKDGVNQGAGSLNLDLNSQVNNWVNKMNDVTMVVDLVGMKRLFMITGKFDTQKGQTPEFKGPKLIPGTFLKPIIEILEVLELIGSSGDYASLVKKGLQIAMSNSPNNWEYKFQADKEIPVLQFPAAYLDGPTTPLRLEASLKLGVYFNLAVPIPPAGLPGFSAGAFIEFGAKLSVMCVSIAAATVYAVGQVTLRIAGDTVKGPSLYMKLGFGIELMVGIPVVGNVSVYYAVGIEISLDTTQITVAAFILFRGRAELIGGLVTITIQIEASGKIHKELGSGRTDCIAQVTFSIDVSILFVIDIHDTEQWQEARQIA